VGLTALTDPVADVAPGVPIRWVQTGHMHRAELGEYTVEIMVDADPLGPKQVELTQGVVIWARYESKRNLDDLKQLSERWLRGGPFWLPPERRG
jgi:hypothetical protein